MISLIDHKYGRYLNGSIIGTDISGINNIIMHNKNGLLFIKNSKKDLKEKIIKLINNKNLSNTFGKAAKMYYLKNYRFEYTISEYIKLYKNVLA